MESLLKQEKSPFFPPLFSLSPLFLHPSSPFPLPGFLVYQLTPNTSTMEENRGCSSCACKHIWALLFRSQLKGMQIFSDPCLCISELRCIINLKWGVGHEDRLGKKGFGGWEEFRRLQCIRNCSNKQMETLRSPSLVVWGFPALTQNKGLFTQSNCFQLMMWESGKALSESSQPMCLF